MARTTRGGHVNPGSWLLGRCRRLTDVKQRETLTRPVTFYDGDGRPG
jgi:hypothetical protein